MDWDTEAEKLMERVPRFVRRFARKRVEQMVRAEGGTRVTVEACRRARARIADEGALSGKAPPHEEPPLYQVEACAGPERDCPFALRGHDDLACPHRRPPASASATPPSRARTSAASCCPTTA